MFNRDSSNAGVTLAEQLSYTNGALAVKASTGQRSHRAVRSRHRRRLCIVGLHGREQEDLRRAQRTLSQQLCENVPGVDLMSTAIT